MTSILRGARKGSQGRTYHDAGDDAPLICPVEAQLCQRKQRLPPVHPHWSRGTAPYRPRARCRDQTLGELPLPVGRFPGGRGEDGTADEGLEQP